MAKSTATTPKKTHRYQVTLLVKALLQVEVEDTNPNDAIQDALGAAKDSLFLPGYDTGLGMIIELAGYDDLDMWHEVDELA